jgi:hypothetical protein
MQNQARLHLPFARQVIASGLHLAHGEDDAADPREPPERIRNGKFPTISHEASCVVNTDFSLLGQFVASRADGRRRSLVHETL